jgi:serine phosphatase RsbU (regulator of sigma subunit)
MVGKRCPRHFSPDSFPNHHQPPLNVKLQPRGLLVLAMNGFLLNGLTNRRNCSASRVGTSGSRLWATDPKEIISTICAAVLEFSGGTKQQKDLTAVIAKRTPFLRK